MVGSPSLVPAHRPSPARRTAVDAGARDEAIAVLDAARDLLAARQLTRFADAMESDLA